LITRSSTETIVWDAKKWQDLIMIEEDFGLVTSTNRYCNAIIQDSLYKVWSNKVLKGFSDDFEIDEDDHKVEKTGGEKQEVKITGPFNQIAPLFIDAMIKRDKNSKHIYIDILKNTQILPYKVNIVHYFAYTNNSECISNALKKGSAYMPDNIGKFPLQYAI